MNNFNELELGLRQKLAGFLAEKDNITVREAQRRLGERLRAVVFKDALNLEKDDPLTAVYLDFCDGKATAEDVNQLYLKRFGEKPGVQKTKNGAYIIVNGKRLYLYLEDEKYYYYVTPSTLEEIGPYKFSKFYVVSK